MPEMRFNPVTGDWVIVATERARRPEEFAMRRERTALPRHVPSCPFCPGNEAATPAECLRVPGTDGDWSVRVVPNRFAALTPDSDGARRSDGLQITLPGVGRHEVIVDTPFHDLCLALLPVDQVERVMGVYRDRIRFFYQDRRIEHVIIFANHGEAAGTSLAHPHSQIVGMPVIPGQLRKRMEESLRFWGGAGECLYCRTMNDELAAEARIVAQSDHFVAFVPFAALSPFHIWIFPRRHLAYFGDTSDPELADLATVLRGVLDRLHTRLDDPDYNFVIRSLSPQESALRYFHWYLSLIPRVTKAAGFELGTGMFINTALPEASAAFLRG
jgi:UDPglucose--hexose-1-phosphate uridylyltransferase